MTVSSGNAGYWAKNADPIGYLYSDGVSMQTDGQPGSYANSLTVASVDNDGFIGNYLLIGQDPIAPSETTGFTNKPISTIVGEHEFVFFSEDATKYAVDAAGKSMKRVWTSLYLPVPYSWYERMKLEVAAFGGLIRDTQFGADVELEVLLPEARTSPFLERLRDMSGATLEALITGQEYRAFPLTEVSAAP